MFNDLREVISKVDEFGECKVIEGADWDLEIGCLSELQAEFPDSPLLLFDNIKGYRKGFRVATNVFSSPKRLALAAGLPLEARGVELVRAWRQKTKAGGKLIAPVQVDAAPMKENVRLGGEVNLYDFPAPKWRELDGGRFIGTGAVTVLRD
ncbi:MAG: UbiD family decarboxylase, partial [Betaproteobacteria bacterium]|nr:UbiD family decarboxylase [Betaproteobacteria bacterium]